MLDALVSPTDVVLLVLVGVLLVNLLVCLIRVVLGRSRAMSSPMTPGAGRAVPRSPRPR